MILFEVEHTHVIIISCTESETKGIQDTVYKTEYNQKQSQGVMMCFE